MATDLRLAIPNRPGLLVRVLGILSAVNVNIDGFCGDIRPGETWGFVHVLVEQADVALSALERAGVDITSVHEVDVLEVPNRPGALEEVTKRYSDAGRNIEVLYIAHGGRVVVGTEDMRPQRHGVRMDETG